MKFTLNWLKKYLDTNANLEEISKKLTAIGLEVEEITDKSKELNSFKIAQILDAKPHPDADKLQVCQVNTGNERLQIVCGAPNARPGINVVLAPVGSVIPTNGLKIKASKIRGVESNGMLCSAAELGLGEDSAGIIEMPASNDNIAKPYAEIAGLNDPVIEIAITPNRGDCLGVYGIARDLAAAGLGKLKALPKTNVKSSFKSDLKINIDDKDSCPLFIGRVFKNVKNGNSPEWLKNKLNAIGIKPISALVDITNYITFEFGRPLHVYDAKKISGELNVRAAKKGEKILALDNKEYSLDENIIVVADSKKPQAIAGVIGGEESGVDENTTDVILEVALFDGSKVASIGRALDVITDSRYRFERNVDPAFLNNACDIASQMIIDICGGDASEPIVSGAEPKWQREITFDFDFVKKYSGVDIKESESKSILQNLGFKLDKNKISVPSWRSDVAIKEDLVEEIVRIHGYDKIPLLQVNVGYDINQGGLTKAQKRIIDIRRSLSKNGMVEAITWSFMQEDTASMFSDIKNELKLKNPISSELSYMRPSLIPNLIDAVIRNNNRGEFNLALFEIGLAFENTSPEGQKQQIAGIRSGDICEKNIYGAQRKADVFDAKADCFAALEAAAIPVDNLRISTDTSKYYHPGRSGVLKLGKNPIAQFGELHPSTLKNMGAKTNIVAFEIFTENFPPIKAKKSTAKAKLEISDFQASVRDFAFLADEKLAADDLIKSIKSADKKLIEKVSIFDIYQGKGVEDGKKSIAISVVIRASDRTLTEKELEDLSNKIISSAKKSGCDLRG